jgi:hypothetical protein
MPHCTSATWHRLEQRAGKVVVALGQLAARPFDGPKFAEVVPVEPEVPPAQPRRVQQYARRGDVVPAPRHKYQYRYRKT